ncbi:hypothetical protein [Leptospira adleri]|uniref:Glycosyltransferase RgtA/B/C/D-like domain-containing protein n=1 Tax=Leptospira adleri TaxID=2023186 RepID=A0A2M9YJQ8_9LEPT|nr:hypothetical protein [Leptospira adleri]PJZ51785.1 hypothetical protein CH380_17970 [Leptospira adleri]PJZ62274.1 hypothetical protein CH376_08665 [Leptospira adleri]
MNFPGVAFLKRISRRSFLLFLFISFYTILFYESAWLSDDSFITFRVVDNFLNGFGLRWNPLERVQVYTHPLWLFLLIPIQALIGEISISAYLLSYVCGILFLSSFVFFFSRFRIYVGIVSVSFLVLFSSGIFVDYNTSGLENPLSFLLLLLFLNRFYSLYFNSEKSISGMDGLRIGFTTALILLTRLDLILLLMIPLMILFFRISKEERISFLSNGVLGLLPWLFFLLFSIVYYGSIFPNTFYAKTNVISPLSERIAAGWNYVRVSLKWDPIASFVFLSHFCMIFFETIPGIWRKSISEKKENRILFIGMGSVLPVFLYLLWIGGDFMAGRFLGSCLIVSLYSQALFLSKRFEKNSESIIKILYVSGFAVFVFFLVHPNSPFRYFYQRKEVRVEKGVVDERASYQDNVSLKNFLRGVRPESHPWAEYAIKIRISRTSSDLKEFLKKGAARIQKGGGDTFDTKTLSVARDVEITTNVGLAGFYGGPEIHWIDLLGITDPFLARLPGKGFPGHYIRLLPRGYKEYIEETASVLENSELDRFYYEVRLLSEEEIWTRERWKIVFDFMFFGRGNFKTRFAEDFRYPFAVDAYRKTLYGLSYADWKKEDVEKQLDREYFGKNGAPAL